MTLSGDRPTFVVMNDIDQLQANYKQATNHLVAAIRDEETLATPDHSMTEMEAWDAADLKVQGAQAAAAKARDLYKDALRQKNYSF